MTARTQVALVLYPGLTALDAIGPYEVLKLMPDTEIVFVSNEVGPVVTDHGVLVLGATHRYADVTEPDLVLVPGSETTASAMNDPELIAWLRSVHERTRWTASVCTGALILAQAGLLGGRPATTHWMAQRALGPLGAHARPHDRIVQSADRIVTAAGVSAGIDLALWLVAQIHDASTAEMIQLALEYDPQPPFDAGHPDRADDATRRRAARLLARRASRPHELRAVATVTWRQALSATRHRRRFPWMSSSSA